MIVSPRLPAERGVARELKSMGVTLTIGRLDDIRTAYWAADCYVFPVVDPHSAVGVPLSVLEALACGVPVVSTRFDGLGQALGEEWPGMTWAAPDRISAEVDAALSRSHDATAVAAAVHERFGREAIAMQYLSIYERLLDGSD